MIVRELNRRRKKNGQTTVEYETDKLRMRLINTYDARKTFEDLFYEITCRKLAKEIDRKVIDAS